MDPGRIHVGTSGFVYAHWKGIFYPEELPPRLWLERYARAFRTVELNTTFYRLPRAEMAARWRAATPSSFVFAAKGSRFITHMKRLLDPADGLERYLEPLAPLGRKLAVVLWQLPPRWKVNLERLERFLCALPRGVRHAFEFRDASWYADAVCDLLDEHGAAFCEHDLVPLAPPRHTGGFRYLRFHGATGKYQGRYGAGALTPWARDLRAWARAGDAYVYFNNDLGGHALSDAADLLAQLDPAAAVGRRGAAGAEGSSPEPGAAGP